LRAPLTRSLRRATLQAVQSFRRARRSPVLIALGVGACGHAASDINSPGRANATAGFYSVGGNGSTVGSASIVGSGDTSASFAGGSRDRHRKRCWAIGRHHRPLRSIRLTQLPCRECGWLRHWRYGARRSPGDGCLAPLHANGRFGSRRVAANLAQ